VPDPYRIDPVLLLEAYAAGLFPMGEKAEDPEVFWVRPHKRGILPLDKFHLPRSLAKTMRRGIFDIRYNSDFAAVIDGCARARDIRPHTWINQPIHDVYTALFETGYCHTVEAWHEGRLAGGLYGIALGRAFFGESMFSLIRDASKVCLAALVIRLREQGFVLLDTQFVTSHLQRFGAVEVKRVEYEKLLAAALKGRAHFMPATD